MHFIQLHRFRHTHNSNQKTWNMNFEIVKLVQKSTISEAVYHNVIISIAVIF